MGQHITDSALTFYQNNILQIFTFKQKVNNTAIPRVFLSLVAFSKYDFKQSLYENYVKFSLSTERLRLWNKKLSDTEKKLFKAFLFKAGYFQIQQEAIQIFILFSKVLGSNNLRFT